MHARLLLPLLLTLAFVLAACGSDDGDGGITDKEPPTSDGTLVTYGKGGGFAPVFQELVVQADGTATATAEFPGETPDERTAEFELSETELADLTAAVESTEIESYEIPGTCADCFTYSIETASGSTSFDDGMLTSYDDEDPIVSEDVADLRGMLAALLDEHVPGPEPTGGA